MPAPNHVQQVLAHTVILDDKGIFICLAVELGREVEGQEAEERGTNTVHGTMQACAPSVAGTGAREVCELSCTRTSLTHIAIAIMGRKDGIQAVQGRRARGGTNERASMCNCEVNHGLQESSGTNVRGLLTTKDYGSPSDG
jgi:hypothetical protein